MFTALLVACAGDDPKDTPGTETGTEPTGPDGTYSFASRFAEGSSVSYGGQVFRHLLIHDLDAYVGGLTERVDDGGWFPVDGEVESGLGFYLEFDSVTSSTVPHAFTSSPPPLQATYGDVSTDKMLLDKIAGNDPVGQHADWSVDFVGWPEGGVTTPESLVRLWFAEIDDAAVARSNGAVPTGPDGLPIPALELSADGRHRGELLQKFLLGAIAFSQGTDDYLDDDEAGKGLLSPNAAAEEGEPFSPLEHAWDEGFGYFGAARDYGAWSDDLIAGDAYADTFAPDGAIDLLSEVSWGHSTNAGKRDLGAVAPTDLSGEGFTAFLEGRALIAGADGELDEAQLETLRTHRDAAVRAWEGAIAATVVHYINDTLKDMGTFGTSEYVFADHAKHWSELKGFALSFQFNPRSPLDDAAFAELHDLIGTAPALPTDPAPQVDQYRENLLAARALIGSAYGFAAENLGDDNGENGW